MLFCSTHRSVPSPFVIGETPCGNRGEEVQRPKPDIRQKESKLEVYSMTLYMELGKFHGKVEERWLEAEGMEEARITWAS